MNIQECDILNALMDRPFSSQRALAKASGHSLGMVNRCLKSLTEAGYLGDSARPTEKAVRAAQALSPKRAVILAAGFGMRMVPINTETPKGLLEVHGQRLIERTIRQLHAAGIREIYVVVGFMKEHYEYLIDEYGVELIVNADYAAGNNLHSLALALDHLSNSYIIPCDIWCADNPYRRHELYSWYMVSDRMDPGSSVHVNRKRELVSVPRNSVGNAMLGICYLTEEDAPMVRQRIRELCRDPRYNDAFWEAALDQNGRMLTAARLVSASDFVEINTYEQLRDLDSRSNQLRSDAISAICQALTVRPEELTDITVMKKGMTNRSFRFTCRGCSYLMRIPGEGSNRLIDRRQEAAVYAAIAGKGLCPPVVYMDPDSGYKLTRFLDHARVCDSRDWNDVARCMERLRDFHRMKLTVDHTFDLFGQIVFYESLWNGAPSVYRDYRQTRDRVLSLRPYVEAHAEPYVLTHVDAVPDNFLFVQNSHGREELHLIDWEYAGMQDPHLDIAMFCIYSMYSRDQVDRLIGLYFPDGCAKETRIKIYCFIAAAGLLWSNWCEYKRALGVEFGAYSLRQYRYAKDYYKLVREMLDATGGDEICTG